MVLRNFKREKKVRSKKKSGKLVLEKLKLIKVVSIIHKKINYKKIIQFLTSDIFIRTGRIPFQPEYNHRNGTQKFSFR